LLDLFLSPWNDLFALSKHIQGRIQSSPIGPLHSSCGGWIWIGVVSTSRAVESKMRMMSRPGILFVTNVLSRVNPFQSVAFWCCDPLLTDSVSFAPIWRARMIIRYHQRLRPPTKRRDRGAFRLDGHHCSIDVRDLVCWL
jgi:hypothetical protein